MAASHPINDVAIKALSDAGLSSRQISPMVGVSWSTVCQRLKHLTPRASTQIFIHHRADILAEMQRKLMAMAHKRSTKEIRDLAVAFGVYYDKERLERGQSSMNQAIKIEITRFTPVMGENEGKKLSV
jgi:transposase